MTDLNGIELEDLAAALDLPRPKLLAAVYKLRNQARAAKRANENSPTVSGEAISPLASGR